MAPLPLVSLCTGSGQFDQAVANALWPLQVRPALYVEREAFAAAYLVGEMAAGRLDEAPVWSDIASAYELLRRVRKVAPGRSVLTAGFPCQPWSASGKHEGAEDERWIWPEIARAIRNLEPGLVVLENVTGLALGGLGHVLRDLAQGGYHCAWTCLRASDVGAPHRRWRLFVVALADGNHIGCHPTPGGRRSRQAGTVHPQVPGAPLDHGSSVRFQGVRRPRGNEGKPGNEPYRSGTLPPYPPGPGDLEAWRTIPSWAWPATKGEEAVPAICLVAHGLVASSRIDLIRLAGNGVVPDQAETAVSYLLRTLEEVGP